MTAPTLSRSPSRRVVAALLALSAIPVLGALYRVGELTGGAEITPANARFFAAPIPVLVHATGAIFYLIVGAFQFIPRSRRRPGGWHRISGRLLVPTGLAVCISGLWMTLFYPRPEDTGDLLTAFRLVFGSAMTASIVLGFRAIRRRDFASHRAWMIRGYAIGIAVGTQAITLSLGYLAFGTLDATGKGLLMGAGWAINLAVAEWLIRSRPFAAPTFSTPIPGTSNLTNAPGR